MRPALRRWGRRLTAAVAALTIAVAVMAVAGLVAGYRPVVITTGSMGGHAPAGSLVIAAPTDTVEVGDVLVMRRPGRATVTHRVVEIQGLDDGRFAITRGDANEEVDPAPYPLRGEQLVGRTVIPGAGSLVTAADDPAVTLLVVTLAAATVTALALRRIWRPRGDHTETPARPIPTGRARDPKGHRRRRLTGGAVIAGVGLLGGGVAWAVYSASDSVAGNTFTTRDCYDAQPAAVQHGQVVNSVDGTQTVPIAAVDPTTAFVIVSTRSAADEPADTLVQAHLAGPTTLELTRRTDGGPSPVVVDWSVVEYGCGVAVQRGVAAGNGLPTLDLPLSTVDPATSFVLLSAVGGPGDTDFDGRAMAIAELVSPTTVRLRSAATGGLPTTAEYAWQVVSFADPADAGVQRVATTLAGTDDTLAVTPVDLDRTLVLATATTDSAGADVGERMVRVHLQDATTVAVHRDVAGDPIEVHVEVIELGDGSTVDHGTIDFAVAQAARTVTVTPVDPSRATALGTVQIPGSVSGGSTSMTADDVAGEAAATFELTDPTTVTITRDATTATASFGWQLVEWGGPTWWDPTYPFRQRIDVTTATAAAPGGYSAPVTVDHAALVATGLARADGDDVRIVRWDGSAWTELDRILADGSAWNAADTTLWFRTTDAIAATTTDSYWLHFGNPAAGSPPADPEQVWLLTEDFESGTLGDFEDRTVTAGWYQADPWTRRISFTVAAGTVSADLTDVPLLVSVTNPDLAANAQADGGDLRFTAADGVTPLAHEVDAWDPGTGSLTAWVQVPSLPTGSATTVWLYYGAPNAPTQDDLRATWPTSVQAAWHLGRDPAGPAPQADDATVWNRDGVSAGGMTAGDLVPGLVGDAVDLDGVDDRFDLGSWEIDHLTELTVSGWVQLDSFTNDGRVFSKASTDVSRVLDLSHGGTAARVRLTLDSGSVEIQGGTLSLGTWHHLAGVWDGATLSLYVDGSPVASAGAVGSIVTEPTMPVTIGDLAGGTKALDGRIDEVRLVGQARSAAWLDAIEANQRTPAAFAVAGSPETGTWFGQGAWTLRKPIVVDATRIDAALVDHPLLVQLTDADLAAGAQADGDDIVFTAADGVTRLDHELEDWSSGTGALTAWVRVPALDDVADTELFVYYGNPGAVDQQDPEGVFGPDADLIAHLDG